MVLTFQLSDEGDRLDGIACVGKGLDDVVLHYTNHTEARLVTWNTQWQKNLCNLQCQSMSLEKLSYNPNQMVSLFVYVVVLSKH